MKTWMQKTLALALAAAMLCGSIVGVSAAEEEYYNRIEADSVEVSEGYTLKLLNSAGTEVTAVADTVDEATMNVYKNVVKPELTISSANYTEGQQYVVMLLSGGEEIPTKDNIRYIDQDAVATFTIYPDDMKQPGEYNVIVSSAEGKDTVATFNVVEPPYKLGDVDGSGGEPDIGDVTRLLRYLVKLTGEDEPVNLLAANVNGDVDPDGNLIVDIGDVTKLLRVVVKLESL